MKNIYLLIIIFLQSVAAFADNSDTTAQRYIEKLNARKQKNYGPFVNGQLLFPTVIQNVDGELLGLAYSSVESLKEAIEQRKGIYYSRSRQEIWVKSPSGKNSQDLIDIKFSCDGTALLFVVKQRGVFCHEDCKSCFDASLNEDLVALNPLPALKIGFCKGRQSEITFDLLSSIGVHVYKNQRPRSADFLVKSDLYSNIQLIELRSGDIATILNQGTLDIALCYDNLIPKYDESKFIKLGKQQGIHPVKVVVIKREGEIISASPTIFSEYPDLTREWALQNCPGAQVVHVHGGAENLLAHTMCDLAVAVKDSGSTLKANNLEVYDTICDTDLYVYVSLSAQEKHPSIVRALKNSLQDTIIYFFSVDGVYGFLSNFYPAEFATEDGEHHDVWRSSEHYYQAHKFEPHGEVYREIKNAKTAKQAYKIACRNSDKIRHDWADVKEMVMQKAILYKFSQNPELKQKLLETAGCKLAEHAMKDYYWGIGADGNGKNRLGQLLMELRTTLAS